MTFLNKNSISELLSTFLYVGKIKYCPGTFGSFVSYPIAYMIMYFTITNQIILPFSSFNLEEQQLLTLFLFLIIACIALFIIGVVSSSIYSKSIQKDDPKEVVIDEVAGQLLVISLCSFSIVIANNSNISKYLSHSTIDFIFLFVLPFCLFRLFDIFKPWPINWCDKNIKGGFGIMFDDIVAAIFASVAHYTITFFVVDTI